MARRHAPERNSIDDAIVPSLLSPRAGVPGCEIDNPFEASVVQRSEEVQGARERETRSRRRPKVTRPRDAAQRQCRRREFPNP